MRRRTLLLLPHRVPPLAPLLALPLAPLPAKTLAPLPALLPALLLALPWKKARKWPRTLPKTR
jgi:hypothetical protein